MKEFVIPLVIVTFITISHTIWDLRRKKAKDDEFINKYKSFNKATYDHFKNIYKKIKR